MAKVRSAGSRAGTGFASVTDLSTAPGFHRKVAKAQRGSPLSLRLCAFAVNPSSSLEPQYLVGILHPNRSILLAAVQQGSLY
jgi:hypothetical protein